MYKDVKEKIKQKEENQLLKKSHQRRTDERTDGRTNERTERPALVHCSAPSLC